jgi:hypothetical protein
MSLFDILKLIPRSLQREIVAALVDLVSKQAGELPGGQVAGKVKRLRSDAAFVQAFQEGLQRAADRFARELLAVLMQDLQQTREGRVRL